MSTGREAAYRPVVQRSLSRHEALARRRVVRSPRVAQHLKIAFSIVNLSIRELVLRLLPPQSFMNFECLSSRVSGSQVPPHLSVANYPDSNLVGAPLQPDDGDGPLRVATVSCRALHS